MEGPSPQGRYGFGFIPGAEVTREDAGWLIDLPVEGTALAAEREAAARRSKNRARNRTAKASRKTNRRR